MSTIHVCWTEKNIEETTIRRLGSIVLRPLRIRKIVAFRLSTICAGVKGLSCCVSLLSACSAVCLFSVLWGGDLLSSPAPKSTRLQLSQGQSTPPPNSFKRPTHSSTPHQFAVTFGSLRKFSWFPAPPPLITAWSAKPWPARLVSQRDSQKQLTYFNQLWTH